MFSLGIAALHASREDDLDRIRPAVWAYVCLAVLQGAALARFPQDFAWAVPAGWLYVATLIWILVVGLGLIRADWARVR